MYKAGHLLRRSSVRLKSLSKGHTNLQMIISQLREVRSSFKAFVAAQVTLSEDLVRWSSTLENESLHQTFGQLAELTTLWTEAQRDFVDNLKHLRCNFDLLLEGERHVDQARHIFASREEAERNIRRELQKAYNKATCEEIHLLRERLGRAEKAKELAHLDVVDRIRENEAIRMIRVKDGTMRFGSSYIQMAHKASIIFNAQQKIGGEIPDVHDKAIQAAKYKGNSGVCYIEEAKEQLRCYSFSPANEQRQTFHDPPPPYSPSKEKLNDLTQDLSTASLNDTSKSTSYQYPSAPNHNPSSVTSSVSSPDTSYPTLPSPTNPFSPDAGAVSSPMAAWSSGSFESECENGIPNSSPSSDSEPTRIFRVRASSRKRATDSNHVKSPSGSSSSSSAVYASVIRPVVYPSLTPPAQVTPLIFGTETSPPSEVTPPISQMTPIIFGTETPPSSNSESPPLSTVCHESPPPYNPFYEWSEFTTKTCNDVKTKFKKN